MIVLAMDHVRNADALGELAGAQALSRPAARSEIRAEPDDSAIDQKAGDLILKALRFKFDKPQ